MFDSLIGTALIAAAEYRKDNLPLFTERTTYHFLTWAFWH